MVFLLAEVTHAAEVKVFPAKGQDVSIYRTYHWVAPKVVTKQGVLEDDPDVAPLIKKSINQQLTRKGYSEVPAGGELVVQSAGLSVVSSQLEGYLLTWGFDPYWGTYDVTTASPVSRVNREGTLLIALIEAKTKKVVWSGYTTEALGRPSTLPTSIDKAASRLFKKLPASKNPGVGQQ
jgi:hypothetical protein